MEPSEIEKRVIEAFVAPHRRVRYPHGFGQRKKRDELTDRLNHTALGDFDEHCMLVVPRDSQNPEAIGAMLVDRGAPSECYVISCGWLDGRIMQLDAALQGIVGTGMGTVLSSIHGVLAYYESEERGMRFVLHKRRASLGDV